MASLSIVLVGAMEAITSPMVAFRLACLATLFLMTWDGGFARKLVLVPIFHANSVLIPAPGAGVFCISPPLAKCREV